MIKYVRPGQLGQSPFLWRKKQIGGGENEK